MGDNDVRFPPSNQLAWPSGSEPADGPVTDCNGDLEDDGTREMAITLSAVSHGVSCVDPPTPVPPPPRWNGAPLTCPSDCGLDASTVSRQVWCEDVNTGCEVQPTACNPDEIPATSMECPPTHACASGRYLRVSLPQDVRNEGVDRI